MRSGFHLNTGPFSFLAVVLFLCLSGALLYAKISGGGLTVFFLVLTPGVSAGVVFFVYFLLRQAQETPAIIKRFSVQPGDQGKTAVNSAALQPGPDPAKKEILPQDLLAIVEKGKNEWEATFDADPDYIVILDRDQRILRMNRAMASLLGIHPRDAVGKFCCPVIHGTDGVPDFCSHQEVLSLKKEVQKEIFDPRLGGHLLFSMSPVLDEAGEVISIVQIGRDINKLKETAEDLKKARSFMQQVIDSISETLLIIDSGYHILLANKAAKKKFLLEAAEKGKPQFCYQATHGFDKPCPQVTAIRCPLFEVKKIGLPVSIVHQHTDGKGAVIQEELSATPFFETDGRIGGIIEVGRDISERLRLEEENRKMIRKEARSRKDKSIGTLAGGVAHDFNNGLTAVLGNAELLKFNLAQDQENRNYAEQIIAAVQKMTSLTRQMLAYAKGGKYFPVRLDITRPVDAALAELTKKVDFNGIAVARDYEDSLWPLHGDSGQLQQAFSNILTNSFEAMKDKGGMLLIKIFNQRFTKNWECVFNEVHPQGDYVHIAIHDNGVGVPSEDFEKVFEPFYTTKFMGRGLGLPAALGIIQNHGGCIKLESRHNDGITVHVLLPKLKDSQAENKAVRGESGGKILVVDDEPPVLEYVKTGLQLNGFEVITAADGFETMQKFNLLKDEIGLVILDVFMPGLDGKDVYRQIKAIRPNTRIALSSGYDEQIALSGLDLQPEDAFLAKPYKLKELLELAERSVIRGG